MIIVFQTASISTNQNTELGLPADQSELTCLLVLGAGVVLVLHLDDALPQVLKPESLGRGTVDVNHLVGQRLAGLGLRELLQQLLDHIKLAPEEGILVVCTGQRILHQGVNVFKEASLQSCCDLF